MGATRNMLVLLCLLIKVNIIFNKTFIYNMRNTHQIFENKCGLKI